MAHVVEVKEDGKPVNFEDKEKALIKMAELQLRFPKVEFIVRPYIKTHYQLWVEKGVFMGGN